MLRKLNSAAGIVRSVQNWRTAILDHAGFLKQRYVCEMRDGLRFNLRGGTDDHHVLFEILITNCYDEAEISSGAVVVDIGANIGCFSLKAAQTAGRVLSYEPFPPNYDLLRENIALNKAENIEVYNVAVGGKAGKSVLFLPDNDSFVGRVSLHPGRGTRTVECASITLDQVLLDNNLDAIDLLKIDCQGAEYEILYSADTETLRRVQQIITECEQYDDPPEWSIKALSAHLQNQGFKVRTHRNLLYAWRRENDNESENE